MSCRFTVSHRLSKHIYAISAAYKIFLCSPRSAERNEDEYVQQEKRRKIDELVRVETELLRLKLDAQAVLLSWISMNLDK